MKPSQPAIVDLTDPRLPLPIESFMKPQFSLIAPGDRLRIDVISFEELSGDFLVSQDGKINLSLLGSIVAAGRPIDDLDQELTQAYQRYFRNLDLSVNVVEQAPRNVYVLGEVQNGGRFAFSPGDRVLHALAQAGGMRDGARENSVVLLRRSEEGGDRAYRLDFSKVHDRQAPADIYLQPGDVVFVPKSRFETFADFSASFLNILSRAATTVLVVDDIVNLRNRTVSVGN